MSGGVAPTPVVVFHPGVQHSWQTATALQQLDRLSFYATSIFYQSDRWPYRIERHLPLRLRQRVHSEFRRFSHAALDPALVRTSGIEEWLERIASRLGRHALANRLDTLGNRRFGDRLANIIHSPDAFALWGFSGSSLSAFSAARDRGRFCILDRTIGDWRAYNRLMAPIRDTYPEYFPTSYPSGDEATIARDEQEYRMADVILVGSEFAAATVRENTTDPTVAQRVRVLNYCYDEMLFGSQPPPSFRPASAPLRFLFVGQAGPRKGIHLALKTFDRIPRSAATLTIIGDLQVPPATFARHADRVRHIPTVARADMPALMADADILLFPSYFEGSALSLIEGLASGLGLIQSANAGAGVTPETGLMLPELSEDALYDAVMTAIEDRWRVAGWRDAAQAAATRYSFARYRENINAMLAETLDRRWPAVDCET